MIVSNSRLIVSATDFVDHSTVAVSPGVVLDVTPPVAGVIHVGDMTGPRYMVSNHDLVVHWERFEDLESGIESFHLAIGSSPGNQDVVAFSKVDNTFAMIRETDRFIDGHRYYALLKVICIVPINYVYSASVNME